MKQTHSTRDVNAFNVDAAAGGYLYAQESRFSARTSNKRMTDAILAITQFKDKRVIDLGCGDGTYTLTLATEGKARDVFGIDPAATAVELATRKAQEQNVRACRFMVGSVYDPATLGGPYDIAVLRGVLHHLDRPAEAVATALAVAPEVVILEPNGLSPVLKAIETLSAYHREHGEQSFLPSTLRRWIREGGGRVADAKFINLVPMFSPDWLASFCKAVEPLIEAVPGLRAISCGQYVLRAVR